MRIEDLDGARARPELETRLLEDLRWLGLDWDEGPERPGPYGPYRQSERIEHYERAFERLRESGSIYPCTCSRKEIADSVSAPHGSEPIYPGICSNGPTHPERKPAWRFRNQPVGFVDGIHGFQPPELGAGDFVIRRADGVYAYQLAVVVDDQAMKIEEVVRGADLLSSTPRQIALQRALEFATPSYLHVPLVLAADGERLAKRNASVAIAGLRESGLTPERVIAVLARTLGFEVPSLIAARELIGMLERAKLPRQPVVLEGIGAENAHPRGGLP